MSQEINSPTVVGVFALFIFAGIILVLITTGLLHKLDQTLQRRRDTKIFKTAEEARRDFR